MRIATSILLLALYVSINNIELSSQGKGISKSVPRLHSRESLNESSSPQLKTSEDLFHGYNGVMPAFERVKFEHQFRNFETFQNQRMDDNTYYFMRRNHIIFGWSWGGNFIEDPWRLFPNLTNTFMIYDTDKSKWFTLTRDLSQKLGANRRMTSVAARDEVAATHKLTSNYPVYREAHIRACRHANDLVDIVEKEQEELLYVGRTTIENIIGKIKEEYSQAYDRAFTLHLFQHGEYNINGHRERHD